MIDIVVPVVVFFSVALFEGAGFIWLNSRQSAVKGIQRLQKPSNTHEEPIINILRKDAALFNRKGLLDRIFSFSPGTERLKSLLLQANMHYSPGLCILASLIMVVPGLWLGSYLKPVTAAAAGFITGLTPFFYIMYKKRQRARRFQEQLPDAVEMIARALKAGHSFTAGLQITAEEMPDPLGGEFKRVFREVSYMKDLSEALEGMSGRVDCPHLKFFAAAASLQEGTGGNMVELLENIAAVVRQRLKLEAQVRALSAEGRFSALVMILLPLGLAFYLYSATNHLAPLLTDPLGKKMAMGAIILMTTGALVIKNITDIKI